MKYATVCSGIEAPSVAWHPLGWQPVFFSQYDPKHIYETGPDFPSQVLAHHYPDVPNLGDMETINGLDFRGTIDLICGGTPCQSFSVAGLRKGMDDPRGNLALVFLKIVDQVRPRWVVWENVPGVQSSVSGEPESAPPNRMGVGPGERYVDTVEYDENGDFSCFVAALGQLGYGWSYRVLDAQYFGVPQRRRRVFVVGHLGDWAPATAVLFEQESLFGYPKKGRKAKQAVAPCAFEGVEESGWPARVAPTLPAEFGRCLGIDPQHIHQQNAGLLVMSNGQANCELVAGQRPALTCNHEAPIVFQYKASAQRSLGANEICPTIEAATASGISVAQYSSIRRITPREAERLQGFPDDYTKISAKTADAPRYTALGNSMAVPVMRWLGERIQLVNSIIYPCH